MFLTMATQHKSCDNIDMSPTADELAQIERFDAMYDMSRSAVLQRVTDEVCGCGYVGTSWATLTEAGHLLEKLELRASSFLLELGAGAGWPGLYLVQESGCHAVLVDMPETGLKLAMERAAIDGIADRVDTIAGDAADLPLPSGAFTAINHSDLLCCLIEKQRVLDECHRVLAPNGLMAFTVVSVATGLSSAQRAFAIENGPPFIEAVCCYPEMLKRTGWRIIAHEDLTNEYEASCKRLLATENRYVDELTALLGPEEVRLRSEKWKNKVTAVEHRLTLREFYLVTQV